LSHGQRDESFYRGEKKYGLKDGMGSMRTPKGDYYVGQWKRGLVQLILRFLNPYTKMINLFLWITTDNIILNFRDMG
jgi:hypothetical protein